MSWVELSWFELSWVELVALYGVDLSWVELMALHAYPWVNVAYWPESQMVKPFAELSTPQKLLSSVCNTWTPVFRVKQSDISHITLAFYLLVNHPPPSHDANVIEPTCIGLPTDKIRLSHTTTKTHLHHFYHVLGDPATGLGELLGAHLWCMKVRRVCVCVCVCVCEFV